jgi:hypothetical protein
LSPVMKVLARSFTSRNAMSPIPRGLQLGR